MGLGAKHLPLICNSLSLFVRTPACLVCKTNLCETMSCVLVRLIIFMDLSHGIIYL